MGSIKLEEYLPEQLPPRWSKLLGQQSLDMLARVGRNLDSMPASAALMTPTGANILRAFATPPEAVRAVIFGQDPYPGLGHASGLAFSVEKTVSPLPASLRNIRTEYSSDVALPLPSHGDLQAWAHAGVLLLNRHLSTLIGSPGAHRGLGWADFTNHVVSALAESSQYFVAILWGREAQELKPLLGNTPTIESAHPSPLSAHRGFFGSRPFSRTNRYREEAGFVPIDWSLGVEQ